jgi:hypothetical protein
MKYLKWGAVAIVIILVIGGLAFTISRFFVHKEEVVETPEAAAGIEEIVEQNKADLEKAKPPGIKISSAEDIYSIIHRMSNTLIEAEDGLIYGEISINEEQINSIMKEVNSTNFIDSAEKKILLNILNRWKQKDYSQGVKDHNYVWNKLGGNIGKAKALRPEYRK